MNNNYESHAISRRSFLKASGVVGAAGILAACGGNSGSSSTAASSGATSAPNTTGATPLKEFISWEATNRELESWNMLYSQMASDMNVTTNLWEGLLSFDCYGKAVPSVAKEWSHNEDSSVWTFNLRDDVDWVDVNGEVKAHLTSKDFLVGLEWVLNAAKNQANNTSMPNETLTGAADYYQKTSDMGDAAADLTYQDMLDAGVGVEAPDDYTLVFTCKDPCPYFDTVAAYTSFYPVSEDLINELGIEGFRACDYTNMWYNGPYVVEEFISQNTKSYIPNPNYFGANDVSRFDRFTVTMISDGTVTFQLYQNRELDEMDVGESTLTTIQADPNSEYNAQLCEKRPKKYSYQMHFNYQKNNEDGTPDDNWNKAIANTAFRQCFYKGLELTNWYARTNKINPLKCENDCYTMPGVCYNTQGQEYTTLVAKEMGFDGEAYDGKTMIRLRSNNGDIADLKKQAMDELSAVGVTRNGGLAEQFTAPATVVYKLPDNVSLRDAAAIEPVSCAVHGLDLLKLRPYQKALVIGDGFMGQIFAQLLQAYGVHQVDLAGIFDEKLQRNKEQFGVTETYNTTREQIPADSYDVIVEAVGLPTTQAQAVAAAKKGAQVLMFGVGPQEAHFEMNTYDIYKKQLTIQGSFINPLTFRDAISLVSSGKMNIGGLISHELELEQVQDFLDGKITGVSKAVVKVGK